MVNRNAGLEPLSSPSFQAAKGATKDRNDGLRVDVCRGGGVLSFPGGVNYSLFSIFAEELDSDEGGCQGLPRTVMNEVCSTPADLLLLTG